MEEARKEISVFGDFLRKRLIAKGISLRALSRESGIDPSNLSKIERGVAFPPKKPETLAKLAKALELEPDDKQRFLDLAAQVNGMLPTDLDQIKQNEAIPLLLRTIQNRKLTAAQTTELAELVAGANNWQGRVVE